MHALKMALKWALTKNMQKDVTYSFKLVIMLLKLCLMNEQYSIMKDINHTI